MSAVRDKLIHLLSDGSFYSGRVLGEELGISRSAVWKHIQSLEQYQLEVYAVSGKGYRLSKPIELLDQTLIQRYANESLDQSTIDIEILTEIDSTNRYLVEKSKTYSLNYHVCLAEFQHAGRGRRGRQWVSPFASSLYCSVLWRSNLSMNALSSLGLVIGISLAQVLEELGVQTPLLKWPNDVYWQDKKMGGILIEAAGEVSGPGVIVIGIGLNVDLPISAADKIDQPWVDVARALGKSVSRNVLAASLINKVFHHLTLFEQNGFDDFQAQWQRYDLLKGREISVRLAEKTEHGIAQGVDQQGALLVRLSDGQIKRYYSGEVSVRYDV